MSQNPRTLSSIRATLEQTSGIDVERASIVHGVCTGSVVTSTFHGYELECPALSELVILAVHDYNLSSALMDFGWGMREHFSSAIHPIHIFPPGANFSWVLNGNGRATTLAIDAANVRHIFDELSVIDSNQGLWTLSLRGFADAFVYEAISAFAAQIETGVSTRLLADSFCTTILSQLARRWTMQSGSLRLTDAGLSSSDLARVVEYVNEHLADDISLSDLATLCGLSKFHFLRRFKASTSLSPYRYLLNKRMERARMLLATTRYSIQAVANLCGFSDSSGFIRMFRRWAGTSPANWRAQQSR